MKKLDKFQGDISVSILSGHFSTTAHGAKQTVRVEKVKHMLSQRADNYNLEQL
jgi:hypothetical protein